VLGIIFGTIAARGSAAPRWIIVVLGLIPVATAGFVYHFIGNFIGGHVFLTAGVAAILGGTFVSRKRTGLTAFKLRTGL